MPGKCWSHLHSCSGLKLTQPTLQTKSRQHTVDQCHTVQAQAHQSRTLAPHSQPLCVIRPLVRRRRGTSPLVQGCPRAACPPAPPQRSSCMVCAYTWHARAACMCTAAVPVQWERERQVASGACGVGGRGPGKEGSEAAHGVCSGACRVRECALSVPGALRLPCAILRVATASLLA
jgi:hypothetical protein